ncbi:MAG TPA: DinB family protein [Candidatus Sulfopaludibacter sp.]|jgi:uncharacterized damage-inducible protein DinB|nr:DinB family protein [Candidatus Sulfopaludibacter sp.]
MKLAAAILASAAIVAAQTAPKNPITETSKVMYGIAKTDITKSAEKIPEELWSFKPTPEVRTVGQLFAHIADGQYEFCGVAAEGKSLQKGIEKSATTKAGIMEALTAAFAYCDAAYAKMTDANAGELAPFFGRQITKVGVMDFNMAHTMEHYGNLVTYMRLKNIVPPSSQGQ